MCGSFVHSLVWRNIESVGLRGICRRQGDSAEATGGALGGAPLQRPVQRASAPTRQCDQVRGVDRAAHGRTPTIDFEVQVRPGREAGRALQSDHGARQHLVAIADEHRLQLRVANPEVAGLDLDVVADAAPVTQRHVRPARGHADHRGAGWAGQVPADVETERAVRPTSARPST